MRQSAQKGKIREQLLRLESERSAISERIRTNQLNAMDQFILLFMVRVTPWLLRKLQQKTFLVGTLKNMLWGKKSESARDILKKINIAPGKAWEGGMMTA